MLTGFGFIVIEIKLANPESLLKESVQRLTSLIMIETTLTPSRFSITAATPIEDKVESGGKHAP